MEEEFYLKVYLFRKYRVPPIEIARNSQLKITIETMDYTIPNGSTAYAFAKGAFSDKVYTQSCTVDGNRISFTPMPGFFVHGRNVLQYEIGGGVIPLSLDVNCELSLPDGGQAAEPEQVLPLVQRAEAAAKKSEAAATRAEEVKGSIPQDYTKLSDGVNQLKNDLAKYDNVFELNILPLQGLGDGTYNNIQFTKSTDSVSAVGKANANFGYHWANITLDSGDYTIKLYSNAKTYMPLAVLVGTSGWDSSDLLDDSTIYGGDATFQFNVPNDNTNVYFTIYFFIDYSYDCTFKLQLEKGTKIHGELSYGDVYNVIPIIDNLESEIVEIKNGATRFLKIGIGTAWTNIQKAFDYAIANDLGVIFTPGTYDFSVYHTVHGYEGLVTPKHIIGYGAKIISSLPEDDIDWAFSPLYVNRNLSKVIIEGLEIECTNCRYCIHDEMWDIPTYYHHEYKNLILKHNSKDSSILLAPQCIGGGLGNVGRIDIENCVCASEHANDVNYHGNVDGQTGNCIVYVKDSVFKTTVVTGSVRDYTNFMNTLYVTNCLCGTIPITHTELNAKTIAWNNIQMG